MNTEHPDAMTAEPVVEATKEPLKRTASLKKVTQKLAKALSLNGIKSRLSGVDPADIQMLEQIIKETEQQQDKTSKKKNIIKISLSRGGSRAGSRAASPRIGTQVETAEEAPAQEAAPTAPEEAPATAAMEAAPASKEAPAKPSGWRWGRALAAIAVGVVAGVVVAAHRGQREMRSARK